METWNRYFLTAVFLIFIGTPGLVMLSTKTEVISKEEKRRLEPFPKLQLRSKSLQAFPAGFEAFCNDHLGFRDQFVRLYNYLLVSVFHTSTKPLVLVGRGGWLFFAGDNEIGELTGYNQPPEETLLAWKRILEDRKNWLAERGIYYLYVAPPDKSLVYSEYLPERILLKKQKSTLERFQEVLQAAPAYTNTVDLLAPLLLEKQHEPVYFKSDTHWNNAGAFTGYTAIMNHLHKTFPDLQPMPRQDMIEENGLLNGGDLSLILNLRDQFQEPIVNLKPPPAIDNSQIFKGKFEVAPGEVSGISPTARLRIGSTEGKQRTLIILCDSFGSPLMEYLIPHFKKVFWVNNIHFWELLYMIDKEKPNIVIHLNAARSMGSGMIEDNIYSGPLINDQIAFGKQIINIKKSNLQQHLLSTKEIFFEGSADGNDKIQFKATGNDPQIYIDLDKNHSENMKISGNMLGVKCVINSPAATIFTLYYKRPGEKSFTDRMSYSTPLVKGENTLIFRIFSPIQLDAIRLDPGEAKGEYVIREFVITDLDVTK